MVLPFSSDTYVLLLFNASTTDESFAGVNFSRVAPADQVFCINCHCVAPAKSYEEGLSLDLLQAPKTRIKANPQNNKAFILPISLLTCILPLPLHSPK